MKFSEMKKILSRILNALPLMMVTYVPDLLGDRLRYYYYKKRLKNLGVGGRIDEGVILKDPENISIGDYVWIDKNVTILGEGGVEIGRRVHIAQNCLIQASEIVRIGDYVGIGAGSIIHSATDGVYNGKRIGPMVPRSHRNPVIKKPVTIEKDAFIGTGCIILPGVTVGEGAVIGAGSLVLRNIPPWKIAFGSPAKPVKDRPKITLSDI